MPTAVGGSDAEFQKEGGAPRNVPLTGTLSAWLPEESCLGPGCVAVTETVLRFRGSPESSVGLAGAHLQAVSDGAFPGTDIRGRFVGSAEPGPGRGASSSLSRIRPPAHRTPRAFLMPPRAAALAPGAGRLLPASPVAPLHGWAPALPLLQPHQIPRASQDRPGCACRAVPRARALYFGTHPVTVTEES